MSDPTRSVIADEFLRGLKIATLGVTTAVLCVWFLPIALTTSGAYESVAVEFGSLAVLIALLVTAAGFVIVDRPWGVLRWPMVAVALAATVAATAAVKPEQLILAPHWSWKLFGWFAVLLLMDLPLPWFFGALGLQQAISLVQVLAAGQGDRPTLTEMGVTSLLVASWQGAVAVAAVALYQSGAVARRTAQEEARLRLSERVAEQLHSDRQARYWDLAATTTPLLEGIADGRHDPADPQVRRACSVEAARMRRLFAESDDVTDPLEHEIYACIDVAERRGTAVQASMRGTLPTVPLPARRALTEPVIAVLSSTRTSARVTVVGRADQVTLSVVTDADEGGAVDGVTDGRREVPGPGSGVVEVSRLVSGDRLWLDVTWTPAA